MSADSAIFAKSGCSAPCGVVRLKCRSPTAAIRPVSFGAMLQLKEQRRGHPTWAAWRGLRTVQLLIESGDRLLEHGAMRRICRALQVGRRASAGELETAPLRLCRLLICGQLAAARAGRSAARRLLLLGLDRSEER